MKGFIILSAVSCLFSANLEFTSAMGRPYSTTTIRVPNSIDQRLFAKLMRSPDYPAAESTNTIAPPDYVDSVYIPYTSPDAHSPTTTNDKMMMTVNNPPFTDLNAAEGEMHHQPANNDEQESGDYSNDDYQKTAPHAGSSSTANNEMANTHGPNTLASTAAAVPALPQSETYRTKPSSVLYGIEAAATPPEAPQYHQPTAKFSYQITNTNPLQYHSILNDAPAAKDEVYEVDGTLAGGANAAETNDVVSKTGYTQTTQSAQNSYPTGYTRYIVSQQQTPNAEPPPPTEHIKDTISNVMTNTINSTNEFRIFVERLVKFANDIQTQVLGGIIIVCTAVVVFLKKIYYSMNYCLLKLKSRTRRSPLKPVPTEDEMIEMI